MLLVRIQLQFIALKISRHREKSNNTIELSKINECYLAAMKLQMLTKAIRIPVSKQSIQ